MTEKIKLTREQADALESVLEIYGPDEIIAAHIDEYYGAPLDELTTAELARALFVGYEVERTEAEKHADIKAYYDELVGSCDRHAVECTLGFLGIKIEGVNA